MWAHPDAWPFQKQVDVVALNLHDYFDIIEHPMDMGTIKKMLATDYYHSSDDCISDFCLMFSNCFRYNRAGEEVSVMGVKLHELFHRKMCDLPSTEVEIPSKSTSKAKAKRRTKPAASVNAARASSRAAPERLVLRIPVHILSHLSE